MTGTARRLLLALPLVVCVARSAAAQTACDRACLTGIADQYFAAMVAHVFGLSMFHHPMNEKVLTLVYPDGTRGTRDMTKQGQFDMAAAHIIKVRDRKIHEIEATGTVLPFDSKNGWSDFLR